jgi:structural maintenance of chromosomes protein 6
MGMHIRIKKPEWTSPIERTIGGNMEAFIVTCKQDQEIMSSIMNRVNCRAPIMIGNATPLDTTGKEPSEDIDTMLRVLQIDNDLVRNSLIINQAAEQTVLIADRNEGFDFMYPQNGGKPHNVKVTMSFAAERGAAIRYEYTGRGAQKSSNVPAWQGSPRMKTDIQDQIRMAKETLNQATREMEESRAEDRRLQEAKKAAETAIKNYDIHFKRLRLQFQKAEDARDAYLAHIESNRPQDGKLQELERQLEEVREENESHRASYADIVHAKDAANERAHEAEEAFNAAKREKDHLAKRIEKSEKRLESVESARRVALQEKNEAIQLIDVAVAEQRNLEERLVAQKELVQEFTEEAGKISSRVNLDPGLTPAAIDARIDRLSKDKARAEQEAGGTREELVTAWQHARQVHLDAELQLQGLVKLSQVCICPF